MLQYISVSLVRCNQQPNVGYLEHKGAVQPYVVSPAVRAGATMEPRRVARKTVMTTPEVAEDSHVLSVLLHKCRL